LDRVERLEEEVGRLHEMLSDLRNELSRLRAGSLSGMHPVEALLAQRGFPVLTQGDPAGMLFPANVSADRLDGFYQLLRRYSFRLFLRDLIQFPSGADVGPVSRYCSARTSRSYLASLSALGIARTDSRGGYELIPRHVTSFGPTLEWYVREVLRREFLAPALSGVRLQGTLHGGDYDVIGFLDRRLVYVEVKSSPPRGVESSAVSAFLNRLRELQPHVAIFLVDTQLRMKDKIVPMFEDALASAGGGSHDQSEVLRMVNEIFHVGHALYIVNSRKGIYTNLRMCVQDHLRSRKATRLPGQG
jgi:hypothetical protein